MRIKTVAASLGIALAGAAAVSTVGAGSAAAFQPFSDPGKGIYFGVEFDRAETAALSDSVVPGLMTQFLSNRQTGYILDDYSELLQRDGHLYATPGSVLKEAGEYGGMVGFAVVDPARLGGYQFLVVQELGY
ncbi:hypothetical protein [Nocardia acidivorans]|uniref:hypothetical protein n=1 Tax=Nocardia acidivorans TaxID=404580 RepID=UPI000837A390|nr:hypothetical protein [Nocardia acidivorans]